MSKNIIKVLYIYIFFGVIKVDILILLTQDYIRYRGWGSELGVTFFMKNVVLVIPYLNTNWVNSTVIFDNL